MECESCEEGGHVAWLCRSCASLGTTTFVDVYGIVLFFHMHAPQGYLKVRRVARVASVLSYILCGNNEVRDGALVAGRVVCLKFWFDGLGWIG